MRSRQFASASTTSGALSAFSSAAMLFLEVATEALAYWCSGTLTEMDEPVVVGSNAPQSRLGAERPGYKRQPHDNHRVATALHLDVSTPFMSQKVSGRMPRAAVPSRRGDAYAGARIIRIVRSTNATPMIDSSTLSHRGSRRERHRRCAKTSVASP